MVILITALLQGGGGAKRLWTGEKIFWGCAPPASPRKCVHVGCFAQCQGLSACLGYNSCSTVTQNICMRTCTAFCKAILKKEQSGFKAPETRPHTFDRKPKEFGWNGSLFGTFYRHATAQFCISSQSVPTLYLPTPHPQHQNPAKFQ